MSAPATVSRLGVPDLGVGVGLRVPHFHHVTQAWPAMDFFEIISENFMVDGGSPLPLPRARAVDGYPIVQHGVSMSIGGAEEPRAHERGSWSSRSARAPRGCSDHVCFTGSEHINAHDLLPVPYTPEMLDHMVERSKRMAGRARHSPSHSRIRRRTSRSAPPSIPEWAFVAELAERADIGLLLDVNNVFVSSVNHGFDPREYLDAIPADRVVQIHLAGHSIREGYRLDTHDAPVCDEVWALYGYAIERIGSVSTLIEWDGDIPSFERLSAEADRARSVRDAALARGSNG